MTAEESAAAAGGYARTAADSEIKTPKVARTLYLMAAQSFNEAARLSTSQKDIDAYGGWAHHYYNLSEICVPQAVPDGMNGIDAEEEELVLTEIPSVSFDDIGGLEDVKEKIRQSIIYPFENPDIYEHYGVNAGGGVLLYGPPGTGKTLIAKATAHECGAAFISVKTSGIMSKFVGESEQHIKRVFEEARKHEKAIIFFDEIDSIAGRRADAEGFAKRIVNELLAQMDGVESGSDSYLVIGATNEPWEIDPALRRPGRFGTLVHVKEPDGTAREQIFKINLDGRPCSKIDYKTLAAITEGYSGADISAICEEAALVPLGEALRGSKRRDIAMADLLHSVNSRMSSVDAWYNDAERMIKKYGDSIII
jgi:transitional endoplasmic reticulum ATPase